MLVRFLKDALSYVGDNEVPLVRGLRLLFFAGASAAVEAVLNVLTGGGFEVPAGWEWTIPVSVAVLASLDKYLRLRGQ